MHHDDVLIHTGEMEWSPLVEGIGVKLLYSSRETGRWAVLLNAKKGASFSKHRHYGPGEYYVVSGRMEYRAGTAVTGDYGYEPLGAVHEQTAFSDDTLLYFTNYGPVLFLDEDDNVTSVLDNEFLENLTGGGAAAS